MGNKGNRGLEICGHGLGSTFLVAIHGRLLERNHWDSAQSPFSLRYAKAHRSIPFQQSLFGVLNRSDIKILVIIIISPPKILIDPLPQKREYKISFRCALLSLFLTAPGTFHKDLKIVTFSFAYHDHICMLITI